MEYANLEKIISYTFNDKKLLETAMTHSSYANDVLGDSSLGNERLEFLGDAYLDAIIGEELFKRLPNKNEGFLSKVRAEIVCEKSLAGAALKLGMNQYLLLGKGEEATGGRTRMSLIADSVEALIAAVYLDSYDLEAVRHVILTLLEPYIQPAIEGKLRVDSKTHLQEDCQRKGITDIKYAIVGESGPDHRKVFIAAVYILGKECGRGSGQTKKEAEANAAADALSREE